MIPHAPDSKQELVDDEYITYNYENDKEAKWHHKVLLNRPLRISVGIFLVGFISPVLVYLFVYTSSGDRPPSDGRSMGTCIVSREARLPCGNGSMPREDCHPDCCYDLNTNVCFHRFPSRFSYILNQNWTEETILTPRITTVPFNLQDSVSNLRISIDEISETHLSITFYNAQDQSLSGKRISNKNYKYSILSEEMNIEINGTQGSIFRTANKPLIATDNLWEIALNITNEALFGLGEIPLKDGTVKILYNHDGGLSSVPLIFAKSNGSYHGLLIDSTSPTEVSIHGLNQIVVRSITNQGLKFHIFVGPKPSDVMNDVRKLIGTQKQFEYWMLGAHICNDIEENTEDAYNYLSNFITLASQEKLPYDSLCGTKPVINDEIKCTSESKYMDKGSGLVKKVKKKLVPHLSPYIRVGIPENDTEESTTVSTTVTTDKTTDTTELSTSVTTEQTETTNTTEVTTPENICTDMLREFSGSLIRNSLSKHAYIGLIEDQHVVYPDYENVNDELMENFWPWYIFIDGIILENTWPADYYLKNDTYTNDNNTHYYANATFPYFNEHFETVLNKTLLWNARRPNGDIYYPYHNKYSNNFIDSVSSASYLAPIWTTSHWMKGDVMINRQNINTSWTNLRRELVEAALGGISGHYQWSTPICGDTENYNNNTHLELCIKWYMAGTYMPMIKIHSKVGERHPLAFEGMNKMILMNALKRRSTLMPYFYTVLQTGPLLRPMFYQFPSSDALTDITTQFSVGEHLLIIPNLHPSQSHVHIRIPPGSWYELWSGLRLNGEEGDTVTMTTTTAEFLTLIHGGSIVPMQKDTEETADKTRLLSSFSLTIAIGCKIENDTDHIDETVEETEHCHAEGKLYMTDNMSLIFEADMEYLSITASGDDFGVFCSEGAIWANVITELMIYGLEAERNTHDHHKQITTSIDLCQLTDVSHIHYGI